jgi:hypothetical protein
MYLTEPPSSVAIAAPPEARLDVPLKIKMATTASRKPMIKFLMSVPACLIYCFISCFGFFIF